MSELISIDNIELHIPKHFAKRIKNEYIKLQQIHCNNIITRLIDNRSIIISFTKNDFNYDITLSEDYPFYVPKITINGINSCRYLTLHSDRFKTYLKYITGYDCMCCISYLCMKSWSPSITLDKIIKQLDESRNIKKNIVRKVLLDQIKYKYLNRDIELDTWLFNVAMPRLCLPV